MIKHSSDSAKSDEVNNIFETLSNHYGNLNWWPAGSPYEVIVGAILTQNTAWSNVEKAIANFKDCLSPSYIEDIAASDLVDTIRPAGFFNQKAKYLKAVTHWYKQYGYSVEQVRMHPLARLRAELLSIIGIGPETADSILLYAFEFPTFVVDAYTKRLLTRLNIDVKQDYDSIKLLFQDSVPPDVAKYNNFHAMIVVNAKEHCKSKPQCSGCPLIGGCSYESK